MTKHGSANPQDLDDKSLTICSGLDMVNINYLHVVCQSAEQAKVNTTFSIETKHKIRCKTVKVEELVWKTVWRSIDNWSVLTPTVANSVANRKDLYKPDLNNLMKNRCGWTVYEGSPTMSKPTISVRWRVWRNSKFGPSQTQHERTHFFVSCRARGFFYPNGSFFAPKITSNEILQTFWHPQLLLFCYFCWPALIVLLPFLL